MRPILGIDSNIWLTLRSLRATSTSLRAIYFFIRQKLRKSSHNKADLHMRYQGVRIFIRVFSGVIRELGSVL